MVSSRQKAISDDPQELTKLLVEYYKHLSTLSGVGLIAMLAIYREDVFEQFFAFFTVASFAVALLACLAGFVEVLFLFHYPLKIRENEPIPALFMAMAVAFLFTQAIVSLLISLALSAAWFALLGVFLISSVVLLLWVLKEKLPILWRRFRRQRNEGRKSPIMTRSDS